MFVSLSDFTFPPNLIPSTAETAEGLALFIAEQEEEVLKDLVGQTFYNSLAAGMNALPDYTWSATVATVIGRQYIYGNSIWEAQTVQTGTAPVAGADWTLVEADNIWLTLKNSALYTYNDLEYKWEGMVLLLKAAIMNKYYRHYTDFNTPVGAAMPNVENAQIVSPVMKMSDAWRKYGRLAGNCFSLENTLYGFLYVNGETLYYSGAVENAGYDTFIQYLSLNWNHPGSENLLDL